MAIPDDAPIFGRKLSLNERWNYNFEFGDLDESINEQIVEASVVLTLDADAVAMGLTIETGDWAPQLTDGDTAIQVYFTVDPATHSDPAFVAGVTVGVGVLFTTTAIPARILERTFGLMIKKAGPN